MATSEDDGPLLRLIASRLPYLPPALQQVGEYVLNRPEDTQVMTITTLAKAAGVAESTVSRFAREMDLPSYQALRLGIAESTFARRAGNDQRAFVYDGISSEDAPDAIIAKIEHSSRDSLAQTAARLEPAACARAVELIETARTIVFVSMGASSIAAEEGVMRFTRAGKKCLLYRDQSLQSMVATILDGEDVVLALSDSGQSIPVVEVTRTARRAGASTICITSDPQSPLARASEVALYTASAPSGGALYGESVTAKWGQILALDVLYAAYAARHAEATLKNLKATYAAGIKHSRKQPPRQGGGG